MSNFKIAALIFQWVTIGIQIFLMWKGLQISKESKKYWEEGTAALEEANRFAKEAFARDIYRIIENDKDAFEKPVS